MGSFISALWNELSSGDDDDDNKYKRDQSSCLHRYDKKDVVIRFEKGGIPLSSLRQCVYCTRRLEEGAAHSMVECGQYMQELSKLLYDKDETSAKVD